MPHMLLQRFHISSLYCRRILASERGHFDQASAILDSNSQETKRVPMECLGERLKEE